MCNLKQESKLIQSIFIMHALVLLLVLPAVVFGQTTINPCNGVSEGFVPDPNDADCKTYWSCRNGTGVQYACGGDLVFDRTTALCIPFTGEFECPAPLCGATAVGVTYLPYPNDCQRYYICLEGGTLIEGDCGAGYVFDYVVKACNVPEKAECFVCPPQNPPKLVFFPNKKNCNGYYVCLNGEYRAQSYVYFSFNPRVTYRE